MWHQEWHETAARTAGKRARQLRKLGHHVSVGCMGMQVTRVGRVKLTLLTIHDLHLPIPKPVDGAKPVQI